MSQNNAHENHEMSHALYEDLAALKIRMEASEKRSDKVDGKIDNFEILLSDIRSDVSFIRGKMEGGK